MKIAICALGLAVVLIGASACDAQRFPGYGYGPGMMRYGAGPGMMGGYGMGPGMMGGFGMAPMMNARNSACNADGSVPDFGFRRGTRAVNLSVDDVKDLVAGQLAWNGNPNLKLGPVHEGNSNTVTADVVTRDNSLVERLAFDRRTGFSCFVLAEK
jgi:hypothetical protein